MEISNQSGNSTGAKPGNDPEAGIWLTTADQSSLFRRQGSVSFDNPINDHPTIQVDAARTYQVMEGFGFALTGGSAYLINRLPLAARSALLQELYSTEGNGIGASVVRVSIGASDLSAVPFSYDDLPMGLSDPDLAGFDIWAGDVDVIPVLTEILAINPDIRILASPWSAPPWMKTNHSFVGGKLKPECYSVYADYLVRYIRAMNEHGIPVHAITPQNEPLNHKNEPSMVMEADEQAVFIEGFLGPALRSAGLETSIFCWDHNCDRPDYPLSILGDQQTREHVAGSAWHLYAGAIDVLSEVHEAHPDKQIYFTEQWVGKDGNFAGDLGWHAKHVLIGSIRNWAELVLEWNLAADEHNGPHTPGGEPNCVGALTIGETIRRNVAYYLIAHASRFVRPGSVRIHSTDADSLHNVAFVTPGDRMVLIVFNGGDAYDNFNIEFNGNRAGAGLEAGALGTFVW